MTEPEPLTQEHIEELRLFLASVFGVAPETPFLDPALMRWKYFHPIDGWDEPRSWVFRDSGRLVAHCGIWPLWFEHQGELVRTQHLIDWAASRAVPGVGGLIYSILARRQRLTLTVGGSQEARPLLPKLGFRPAGVQQVWSRPLRPWPQAFHRRGVPLWKSAALLGRNWVWSRGPLIRAEEWNAVEVERLDAPPARSAVGFTALARPASWYDFLKHCPGVRTAFYRLEQSGSPCGSLVLARVGNQARLVDWQVELNGPQGWKALLAVAVRTARADPDAHELLTTASVPGIEDALTSNGFRPRAQKPIFLQDRGKLFVDKPPLQAHMADTDAFFLYNPSEPYST